ncbi:hypothetical protein D1646_02390 [Pseudoflavonifractor sp. 60]|uniref:hypothetical protein n=1 Tax=Pseudoflavonifractor sp. 60 TaxID=2304576 RepID=UPI00136E9139|nr:hypothetical protein [Pseudoflavonifractor sp. 60]MCI8914907.1 hypothetical protein [Lawsonibacter sp.]NBI65677.1 hypothetical protein [Pseudoflavonifractor sp. 60]
MDPEKIRQPNPEWPWTLSEGGNLFRDFTWANIEYDLAELYPDNDSFIILEQKDPADESHYWFIQSAIALKGPNKDDYIVGVGWNGESGPVLLERCYHWKDLDTVIDIFERAFQRKPLDLTGYESFF